MALSPRVRRFTLFCCSGTLAFCVDYAILRGLVLGGMSPWGARVFSFVAAATCTWLFNSRITFSGASARFIGFAGWLAYMSTACIGGAANYMAYFGVLRFAGTVDGCSLFFGVAAGSCAGLAVNYVLCSAWFFTGKSKRDSQTRYD